MREFNSRSIPKPNLPLDLRPWTNFQWVDLEIGAGQGLHAIRYCRENPDRALIALERTKLRHGLLDRRSKSHGSPPNLFHFRADAIPFVVHFLEDQSLSRVFLLYPNPYPKARQANLRWHRHPFIKCLRQKLTPTGTLHLATNLSWYRDEAEASLTSHGGFKLIQSQVIERAAIPRTHFERKYLARGESCFDLIFQSRLQ